MSSIVSAARKYLGTPFVHQGRSGHGLDCVGLLVQVAADLGLEAHDWTAYSLRPRAEQLLGLITTSCDPVEGDSQPGDILIFAMIGPAWPQHAAIRTDRGIIHSYRGGPKCVVEVEFDTHWREKLHSTWRYRWPQ
tara:strand:- start:317 stop:721 length:405 start_codon:yes stop_codon:yes gene_type:complete